MIDLSPRRWMLDPVPEITQAAAQLSEAVDAHLAGDSGRAAALFRAADMPSIRAWTEALWGRENPEIHRYRIVEGAPRALPMTERHRPRMPGLVLERQVLDRDGFHCRFCGIPIVRGKTRRHLSKLYPEVRWGSRNEDQHAAFQAMGAIIDHLLPHSRGGTTTLGNLVVACGPCNNARNERTLAEVGLHDPLGFPRHESTWDGLERVLRR